MRFRTLILLIQPAWLAIAAGLLLCSTCLAIEDYLQNYLQGVSYLQRNEYDLAVTFFDKALGENGIEQKNVRFYGMRYGDYSPHLQKGIAHYHLKQYDDARRELEISLSQLPTPEARKFIDLVLVELQGKRGLGIPMKPVATPDELANLPKATDENSYAVAVVIGNQDYKNKDIPSVEYAIEDARRIRDTLISTYGYREGNIIFEVNATKGTLENIFGSEMTARGKIAQYIVPGKSDLFVYYSGHGAPALNTRKGYLLPMDSDPNNVVIGGYALDTLYRNLANLPFRSLTIVTDACFSGAPLFKKASPIGIVVENPLVAMKNVTIVNSSSGTELSSWYPEKGHSLFTYYFLLGMTGKADTDENKQITTRELSDYLRENVPYMARKLYEGRQQTPTVLENNPDKVLVTYK